MSHLNYKHIGEKNLLYGIEYDEEVPRDSVISSPGFLSSIHHHPTKGAYSEESNSSDIYGHSVHSQYDSGVYGNAYEPGHTSSVKYSAIQPDTRNGKPFYWKNQKPVKISDPDFEIIEPADIDTADFLTPESEHFEIPTNTKDNSYNVNIWILLILIALFYITLTLWSSTLQKWLHSNYKVDYKRMLVYSLISTTILFIIACGFDVL